MLIQLKKIKLIHPTWEVKGFSKKYEKEKTKHATKEPLSSLLLQQKYKNSWVKSAKNI